MSVLSEMQYELGDVVFGWDTPYKVSAVDFGSPSIRGSDTDNPREDGIRMGTDYRGPRTVTFDMHILTDGPALDALATFEEAWLGDDFRDTPGLVMPLRMKRNGRVRRLYGRPRQFASTTGTTLNGWIPVTCTFQCVDHRYYADEPMESVFHLTNPPTSGIIAPLVAPITSSGISEVPGVIEVAGNTAAWTIFEVTGPILRPAIEAVGQWTLTMDVNLMAGETILIDPRPWSRSVLRNGIPGVAAGSFTADSPILSQLKTKPGTQEIVLRGTDPTGTATLGITVENAWTSY